MLDATGQIAEAQHERDLARAASDLLASRVADGMRGAFLSFSEREIARADRKGWSGAIPPG